MPRLIDAEALLKVLPTGGVRGLPDKPYSDYIMGKIAAMQDVVTIIKCAPTIEAEPVRHGRWVHLNGDEWCCSDCCDVRYTEGSWEKPSKKYCNECGCRMDLEG